MMAWWGIAYSVSSNYNWPPGLGSGQDAIQMASKTHRTPLSSTPQRCGGRFILHVFKGPGHGLHVEMSLRPP